MDFPEPVSDANKNCFHPSMESEGSCLLHSISHLMLSAWIGVGFALSPRKAARLVTKPGISGGDMNRVGSSERGDGGTLELALVGANVTEEGGLYSSLNMGTEVRILETVDCAHCFKFLDAIGSQSDGVSKRLGATTMRPEFDLGVKSLVSRVLEELREFESLFLQDALD